MKPNNKIATPWVEYICTLISGYFAGKPITYDTANEELKQILSSYLVRETSHNQSIAKDCSIYGMSAELLFIGEDKRVYFEKIPPESIIAIYSTEITKELFILYSFLGENTDILTRRNHNFYRCV